MSPSMRSGAQGKQHRPKKHLVVFLLMGLFGTNLEIISRIGSLNGVGALKLQPLSLAGWTSVWMFPVYGAAGLALGQLNEWALIRRKSMLYQAALALIVAWSIELAAGYIFNLTFGLSLWGYEGNTALFQGQISIKTGAQFFFISPLVFWADDMVRWLAYGEERPGTLGSYYRGLLSLKDRADPVAQPASLREGTLDGGP